MKTCANCFYKNRKWGDNPCRTCFGVTSDYENWTGIDEEEDNSIEEEKDDGETG